DARPPWTRILGAGAASFRSIDDARLLRLAGLPGAASVLLRASQPRSLRARFPAIPALLPDSRAGAFRFDEALAAAFGFACIECLLRRRGHPLLRRGHALRPPSSHVHRDDQS